MYPGADLYRGTDFNNKMLTLRWIHVRKILAKFTNINILYCFNKIFIKYKTKENKKKKENKNCSLSTILHWGMKNYTSHIQCEQAQQVHRINA